ncbi:hypothetical protein F4604DRAFT_1684593 [Suillus subluteus]|nr:hypothetical protein F4604DRAFT_1684593 [Suillus subluteus]
MCGNMVEFQDLQGLIHHYYSYWCIASDLDESIDLHRAALELRPLGHSDHASSLNDLAISIQVRFKQCGVFADLYESIKLYQAALVLHPPAALELRPPGHSDRYLSLNNLSVSLGDRGLPSDLDEAVELHRAALMLCPPGHFGRSSSLDNLAVSLRKRFKQQGDPSDLDESIDLHRAALDLRPPGHFEWSLSIKNLAICLQDRFHRQGLMSDLNESFRVYSQLSQAPHVISEFNLPTAVTWVTSAELFKYDSALLAYHTTLNILDRRVAIMMSSSHHFDAIRVDASSLAMDAFSCGIRHDALTTAVELVEQGRAIFWTQLARFHTPLDELSASGDTGNALADEVKHLSLRLHTALDASTEDPYPQIQQLIMQWDDVISRIHMLPHFARFLLPPWFSDLQKAAEYGAVIIVNASQYSCNVLIILIDRDPVHIPLDITRAEVSDVSSKFQSLIAHAGTSDSQAESFKIVAILRKLWDVVVGPVVALLGKFIPRGSRIWWCPTAEFTLLPLHAAGPYGPATLIHARQQVSQDASNNHFVAIGQANPEGGTNLREPLMHHTNTNGFTSPVMVTRIAGNHLMLPFQSCHTTVGDKSSPDEAIHLAAAMQFSGFRSVIGSMWSVDDDAARQIVSAFYNNMFDGSGRLDHTRAAIALHKASARLETLLKASIQALRFQCTGSVLSLWGVLAEFQFTPLCWLHEEALEDQWRDGTLQHFVGNKLDLVRSVVLSSVRA